MKHPELLLLPVFMLADYFLTLAGAIQAEKKYRHHFQTEQYELNPAWQQNVARRKWFSLRHLLTTFVSSAILIAWAEQGLSFVTGALVGILLFILLHFYWIQKYRRQKRLQEAAALDSHL